MKLTKTFFLLLVLLFTINSIGYAQFWIGPRFGVNFTGYKYQNEVNARVRIDSLKYTVDNLVNFDFGIAFEYTTTGRYSVHTEIVYQKIKNRVKSKPGDMLLISESTYNFISVPLLVKINFEISSFQFYLNGGPRLSYWVNGKGKIQADELIEYGLENGFSYKVRFGHPSQNLISQGNFFFVPKSNRLQYAFEVGSGITYTLNENFRTYFDFRYTIGHSNMGFNDQADIGLTDYQENIEYAHRILSLSVGVLVGYDPNRKKKGASNIKKRR